MKGLTANIYSSQVRASSKHKFKTPNYTSKELRIWLFTDPVFYILFEQWRESGYEKDLRPSVDRIDDNIGYTMDNIQLMTWGSNNEKGSQSIRDKSITHNGLLNGGHREVKMFGLDGTFICDFISVSQCSRVTGINHQSISRVCRGERNKTKGYRFEY